MSLRDRLKKYSDNVATATVAIPATHKGRAGLAVATIAGVAVASTQNEKQERAERWHWFLSLSHEHGIHSDVVAAEFHTAQDRLDVVAGNCTDDDLRAFMATLCSDVRVKQRQQEHNAGRWIPLPLES